MLAGLTSVCGRARAYIDNQGNQGNQDIGMMIA